jgi:hypothetical protein
MLDSSLHKLDRAARLALMRTPEPPRSVSAHVQEADDFAVIDIGLLPSSATPRRPIPPKADDDAQEQIGSEYGPNAKGKPQ